MDHYMDDEIDYEDYEQEVNIGYDNESGTFFIEDDEEPIENIENVAQVVELLTTLFGLSVDDEMVRNIALLPTGQEPTY